MKKNITVIINDSEKIIEKEHGRNHDFVERNYNFIMLQSYSIASKYGVFDQAADITQDTALGILNCDKTLNETVKDVPGYLYKSASHTAFRELKGKRKTHKYDPSLIENIIDDVHHEEKKRTISMNDLSNAILDVVKDRASDTEIEVLRLCILDDYKLQEVAKMLNITYLSAKSMKCRLKRIIKHDPAIQTIAKEMGFAISKGLN